MVLRDPDQSRAPIVGIAERYGRGGVGMHSHKRAQIMFAINGALTVRTDSGSWVLPPHRALWVPAGLPHGISVRSAIELRTLFVARCAKGFLPWKDCVVMDAPPLIRELILAMADTPWTYRPNGSEARLGRVLLDRLQGISQQSVHLPEPVDARARRFTAHMYAHVDDRRPLAAICQDVGSSTRTIERLFQQDIGMSVGTWTQQLRLVFALELLAEGKPVGDVAFAVGYANPSSFIAVFRGVFGVTPGRYFQRSG